MSDLGEQDTAVGRLAAAARELEVRLRTARLRLAKAVLAGGGEGPEVWALEAEYLDLQDALRPLRSEIMRLRLAEAYRVMAAATGLGGPTEW